MEHAISLQGMTDKECRDLMLKNAPPHVRWYYFEGYANGVRHIAQHQCMSIDMAYRKDILRKLFDKHRELALEILSSQDGPVMFTTDTAGAFGKLAAMQDFEHVLEYP